MRKTLLFVALALALTACEFRRGNQTPEPVSVPDLEGSYKMWLSAGGESRENTAAVRRIAKDFYQIARVTDYGIKYYAFVCEKDTLLFSQELGEGRLSWDEKLGKITIKFNKEGNLCELTR